MNHRTPHPRRWRWERWPIVGLFLSLVFLAHDTSMAAGDGAAMVADVTRPANVHVVHVIAHPSADPGAHPESPLQSCSDDCPPESRCGLGRGAIPAANDGLDLTLQSIMAGCGSPLAVQGMAEVIGATEATAASPGDQQRVFQVLLI